MKKYYFVSSVCYAYGNRMDAVQNFVCDMHPFLKTAHLNSLDKNYETYITFFAEISEGEYQLYKRLEENDQDNKEGYIV